MVPVKAPPSAPNVASVGSTANIIVRLFPLCETKASEVRSGSAGGWQFVLDDVLEVSVMVQRPMTEEFAAAFDVPPPPPPPQLASNIPVKIKKVMRVPCARFIDMVCSLSVFVL
jgi:hypothetical protein